MDIDRVSSRSKAASWWYTFKDVIYLSFISSSPLVNLLLIFTHTVTKARREDDGFWANHSQTQVPLALVLRSLYSLSLNAEEEFAKLASNTFSYRAGSSSASRMPLPVDAHPPLPSTPTERPRNLPETRAHIEWLARSLSPLPLTSSIVQTPIHLSPTSPHTLP